MRDASDHCSRPAALSAKPRRHGSSTLTLLLVAGIVALLVLLLWVILTPPAEPQADSETPKYEPADAEVASEQGVSSTTSTAGGEVPTGQAASSQAVAPPVRPAAIKLPRVAASADAEQLQAEAEAIVKVLKEKYPDTPQALHVAAIFASQTRDTAEAEELWTKCIELEPTQVAYYVNLAAIAMDRGKSELAAETLQRAIYAGLSNPDVQHHYAVALTKLGRCEEAEDMIKKALASHPRVAAYWTVLGQAQLKQRKAAEAEESLKKSLELGAGTATLYYALGNALAMQQKKEEAAKYRELFQQQKPTGSLDKQQRYDVLSRAEALRTAMTVMCEAAALYDKSNNSLESERLLMRAIALDPVNATPYNLLSELYNKSGMLPEARVVQERLLELNPTNLMNYFILAKMCAEMNESAAAEATLKQALAIHPNSITVYASLAQFYLERGRLGHARWYATEAVARHPTQEGYEFLATICRAMGMDQDAEAALAEAEALKPAGPKRAPQ